MADETQRLTSQTPWRKGGQGMEGKATLNFHQLIYPVTEPLSVASNVVGHFHFYQLFVVPMLLMKGRRGVC